MSLDKDGKTPIKGGHQFDKSACKDVISYQTSLYCSPCKWAHQIKPYFTYTKARQQRQHKTFQRAWRFRIKEQRENFLNELFFLHLYSLTLFFFSHFNLNSHVSFYTCFQQFSLIPEYEHQGMKQNKARRSGISNQ